MSTDQVPLNIALLPVVGYAFVCDVLTVAADRRVRELLPDVCLFDYLAVAPEQAANLETVACLVVRHRAGHIILALLDTGCSLDQVLVHVCLEKCLPGRRLERFSKILLHRHLRVRLAVDFVDIVDDAHAREREIGHETLERVRVVSLHRWH